MPPSGLITFLFTDIEDSVRLWEKEPEEMRAALARHDAILHGIVEEKGGFIVKTTGDGLHAAFDAPAGAVNAVLSAQRALGEESWPAAIPLKVRMGLHTGEATWREGDYYGSSVNRAARLMSIANGGQILLSVATAELIRDRLPVGAGLRDLGRHDLRGLARREQIYQLTHPELPAEFPPLKSDGTTPHNLPEQLTSFVGREREANQLSQFLVPELSDGEAREFASRSRLVTLIGPGGTGKTRLSLHVARRVLDHFPDGLWLVELAALTDPHLVIQNIASVFGIQELPGRPLLDMLVDRLRSQRVLLILDNCEHLIDECARVSEALLRACPKLRILASSREALGVMGEQVLRVRSMKLPPEDNLGPDELTEFEAVRLFVERAKSVRPNFELTAESAVAAAQICRRLDGIPLAIELAAARVRALAPGQIAARLDDRFRLLTGGSRTALPRQRTLQALIDWSYDLLSEEECLVLQRLSVFSGGWNLEAAEAVAGVDPIEPFEVMDLLEQLVNKSLIFSEENEWGTRYGMLETVRQYAQEKLAESDGAVAIRDHHLNYFVEQSENAFDSVEKMWSIETTERLIPEADNLRAARTWAFDRDLLSAFRLQSGLTPRWHRIIPMAEALRYARSILDAAATDRRFSRPGSSEEGRRLLGQVLASTANLALAIGLNPRALEYSTRAIEVARTEGDSRTLAYGLAMGSGAAGMLGEREKAKTWQKELLTLAASSGKSQVMAMSLVTFGQILFTLDDPERLAGAIENAWSNWHKGMAMFQEAGDNWGQAWALQMAAEIKMFFGDLDAAANYAQRSSKISSGSGFDHISGRSHSILAEVARQQGKWDQATEKYLETLRGARDFGHLGSAARCLECLAFIIRDELEELDDREAANRLQVASTLMGAADIIRKAHNMPMTIAEQPEYERELAAIQEKLTPEAFQRAWTAGSMMSLDEAVIFATGELASAS